MIKEPKEKSVVEICTIRSIEISKEKRALVALQNAKTEIAKCSKHFLTEDKLKELENEIKKGIIELQMSIALLLKPVVAAHGINLDAKFWFTPDEIRDGYVLLRKPNSEGASHVLFLKDYEDTFDGNKVIEGEIKLYKHVNHFLEKLDADIALKKVQSKSKKNESNT